MNTMVRYRHELPTAYGAFRPGVRIPADLCVVCLWSTLGFALTGLFFALGLGAEIGPALAVAG